MTQTQSHCQLSVVIPVRNELSNLQALLPELFTQLHCCGAQYEVLVVDDHSCPKHYRDLVELIKTWPAARLITLKADQRGKGAALASAAQQVRGRFVLTMDGDYQDDPRYIPQIWQLLCRGHQVVNGRRLQRQHPWWKRFRSFAAAWLCHKLLGMPLLDINSSYRAMPRQYFQQAYLQGGYYRYYLARLWLAGIPIHEIPIINRPRQCGRSHYGYSSTLPGLTHLVLLCFSRKRPLR